MGTTINLIISLGDTDAAGVLFYPRLFELAQRAFEHHCTVAGFPITRFFKEGVLAPVVHVEADYRAPLRLGDTITIETSVEGIGDTSFRMAYVFRREEGTLAGEALVVHACLGRDGKSVPVPGTLREAFSRTHGLGG
jgi:YbgC/YbaW family acyl-CoA thioester hydrolase